MYNTKLILTEIDNCFIPTKEYENINGELKEIKKYLDLAKISGIQTGLCTDRKLEESALIIKELGLDGWNILNGGEVLYRSPGESKDLINIPKVSSIKDYRKDEGVRYLSEISEIDFDEIVYIGGVDTDIGPMSENLGMLSCTKHSYGRIKEAIIRSSGTGYIAEKESPQGFIEILEQIIKDKNYYREYLERTSTK